VRSDARFVTEMRVGAGIGGSGSVRVGIGGGEAEVEEVGRVGGEWRGGPNGGRGNS